MLTKNFDLLSQRVKEHVVADSIIQGTYWDEGPQQGCFIGCLAHSDNPVINEKTYGLPIAVQRIAENIFEGLPVDEAKAFFAALPDAIGCDGKDLSKVSWQFLAAELRSLPPQLADIQAVIDPVIAGMDLMAQGLEWPEADRTAAWDAAWAVRADDWAAAWAARAAGDAWAAAGDAWAAARAARAAGAAAGAVRAAGAAGVQRQRDLLLLLIKEAPVLKGAPNV